ncbi:MAG: glucose-6-phosphate dehydrogenase assembly protein OpcA [Candidatus Eisenbacteria bacterium]
MIADREGRAVLGGGGTLEVDVKSIGRELRRLWDETGEAGAEGAANRPVITRACTRNLIVLAANPEEAERATGLLAAVAGMHPTRAFVVEAGAGGNPERLEAHLQAVCSIRGTGRHVCCEQITMSVGPGARRRAAGTIVPLLVPDLPVFVWVLGEPDWDDELLIRLLDVADRLLVDTRRAADPVAVMANLARRPHKVRWTPGDFEWSRLSPWREAVASLFDEPATATLPARLERVVVRFGAGGSAVGAALIAGWMVDRIAEARERAATGRGRDAGGGAMGNAGAAATAVLEPVPDARAGEICGIELHAREPAARCEVVAAADDHALTARVTLAGSCALPVRQPWVRGAEESLLEDQLDTPGAWPTYEGALAIAASLLDGSARG